MNTNVNGNVTFGFRTVGFLAGTLAFALHRVGGAIMRHLALYPYNGGKKENFSV